MAILKGNILTFQIAEVAQALSENLPDWRVVDDANRCYLMRARSEWPRGHAAQRRYEFSATKAPNGSFGSWGSLPGNVEIDEKRVLLSAISIAILAAALNIGARYRDFDRRGRVVLEEQHVFLGNVVQR
jgi:hypothetical protein